MSEYTSSQIATLQGYIDDARSELAAGNTQAAIQSVTAYYSAQTSTRGYASDALAVINNSGVFGQTANQEVIDAIGLPQYTALQPQLIVQLAAADMGIIASNPNAVPTENQIADYHASVFDALDIPLTAWGGSTFAAVGEDWSLGTLTAAETNADLSQNVFAQNFTDAQIVEAFRSLGEAGTLVELQRNDLTDYPLNPYPTIESIDTGAETVIVTGSTGYYGPNTGYNTPSEANGHIYITPGNIKETSADGSSFQLLLSSGQTATASATAESTTVDVAGGNIVNVAQNSEATIVGIRTTVNVGSGSSLEVVGGGNIINGGAGDVITVSDAGGSGGAGSSSGSSSAAATNVNASGATINLGSGDQSDVVTGNNDTIIAGTNVNFTAAGSGDSITLQGSGGSLVGVQGTNDTVTASQDTILSQTSYSVLNVVGASDTIDVYGSDSDIVGSGSGDTVNAATGVSGDFLQASNAHFTGDDLTNSTISGSNDSVLLYGTGGSEIGIQGTNDSVNANEDTILDQNSNSVLTVSGSGDIVDVYGSNSDLTASGSGDRINAATGVSGDFLEASNAHFTGDDLTNSTIAGSNDSVLLYGNGGSEIGVQGTNDSVEAEDDTILNETSNSVLDVSGSGDIIDVYGSNSDIVASGSNETINTATGDSGDYLAASNSRFTGDDLTNSTIAGSNDSVVLYGNGGSEIGVQGTNDSISGNSDTILSEDANSLLGVDGSNNIIDVYGSNTDLVRDGSDTVNQASSASGFSQQVENENWVGYDPSGAPPTNDPSPPPQEPPLPDPQTNYDPGSGTPGSSYDPIILNVQGGSVQTQRFTASTATFDMQNNGLEVQTGWGVAGEGYLVYDPNDPTDGKIITQDSDLIAGFGALDHLASTVDGTTSAVLNDADPLWTDLKVWVDSTGTGSFTAGSLYSLDQLGITSINLNVTNMKIDDNGNTILADSTFTWANGSSGDIAGVSLAFDPTEPALPNASIVPTNNTTPLAQPHAATG